jgi:regulatory protein
VAESRRRRAPGRALDLHERALRLLAVRARSRHELGARLRHAGFAPDEVEEELERLALVGLVDDERFTREFAQQHLQVRLAGRRAVVSSLVAKGVDRELVERTLDELGGSDAERAEALAGSRAGHLTRLPPERAYSRLVSFLVRRGHPPEVARRAAREALAIDEPTAAG